MIFAKFNEKGQSIEINRSPAEDFDTTDFFEIPAALENVTRFIKEKNGTIRAMSDEEIQSEIDAFHSILELRQMKYSGYDYDLDGTIYKIPLTKEAQDIVTTVSLSILNNAFNETILKFDNGVSMPINDIQWADFARWFSIERNKLFV